MANIEIFRLPDANPNDVQRIEVWIPPTQWPVKWNPDAPPVEAPEPASEPAGD